MERIIAYTARFPDRGVDFLREACRQGFRTAQEFGYHVIWNGDAPESTDDRGLFYPVPGLFVSNAPGRVREFADNYEEPSTAREGFCCRMTAF